MSETEIIAKLSTRDRILAAAMRLFAENGYSATSVRQIAQEVGLRESSLYNHFQNKDEILPETMGSSARIIIIATFLLLWYGLNFYLGWRGWYYFGSYISGLKILYWGVFILVSSAYFLGRWGNHYYPGTVSDAFIWIGSYWMAFIFYALIANLLIDLLRYTDKAWGFLPATIHHYSSLIAAGIFLLIIGVLIYGTVNANRPVVNRYNISIAKPAEARDQLHMVMVSDIHLGNIIGRDRLAEMVDKINHLQPEIVLLAGDIIDGDIKPFEAQGMGEILASLQAPLGVYAVPGNHEYLGGQYRQLLSALQDSGVIVLQDQYVHLDGFYLVGRDDKISWHRRSLPVVMEGVDHADPVILLDHNPVDIEESRENQVDLHLSGHTHRGQFFPLNYFTERIFIQDWGYMQYGKLQLIISNGYGTWGPPIRIGNRPEIVEIIISFDQGEG